MRAREYRDAVRTNYLLNQGFENMQAAQEEQIIASEGSGSSFPPHPADQFAATCIDVIDLGMVETTWQNQKREKHVIVLRFFCGEWFEGNEGPMPLWVDRRFTLSLSEKANLRSFLEAWRGIAFTPEELKGFNVAKLLHAPAFVQVTHNPTPQRTYANITTIMRLPKGMEAPGVPHGYVRVKDRPKDANGNASGHTPLSEPDDDDGLPF